MLNIENGIKLGCLKESIFYKIGDKFTDTVTNNKYVLAQNGWPGYVILLNIESGHPLRHGLFVYNEQGITEKELEIIKNNACLVKIA